MPITESIMTDHSLSSLRWGTDAIELVFSTEDGPVRLIDVLLPDLAVERRTARSRARQPLVEIAVPHFGQGGDESRLIETPIGKRLAFRAQQTETIDALKRLIITQEDAATGLVVDSIFEIIGQTPAVRAVTRVRLEDGADPIRLLHVSSLATAAVISDNIANLDIWSAESSPRAEGRWSHRPLRSPGLKSIDANERGEYTWSGRQVTGFGSRSTLMAVPAGALVDRESGLTFAWQIEHNGPWMWEVGELADRDRGITPPHERVRSSLPAGVMQGDTSNDGAYLVATGPAESRHSWSVVLRPGQTFTTVPVTFTVAETRDDAFGNLAAYRRAARRPHPQNTALPVIFNDYMNTLVGDPTEEKLLPLIDAAARAGAEYFCIDAGWYDDEAGWWDGVGDWEPSTTRFPSGLANVLVRIREHGMVPGLWIEPEVIGVASNAAQTLPDDAFITRDGVRVRVNDRYFLDMRQETARAHVDAAIDRMITGLGAGYFKFDYNITPGAGLDTDSDSLGDGLLQHNRAVLDWIRSLLDRYPDLIIESCSGGGGRTDFATMSEVQLASTSDQENPLAYPAVAVGSLVHLLPEQAGNWAYPQATMSDQEIAFAMGVGLAGRLYLAGVLSDMTDEQLAIVRAGVNVHNSTKHFIAASTPVFPLNLPDWNSSWVSVGFEGGPDARGEQLLLVWALPGALPEQIELPLRLAGVARVERIYPSDEIAAGWEARLDGARLQITRPSVLPAAAMFRITPEGSIDV